MQSITKALLVEELAYQQFGLGVLATDPRHSFASFRSSQEVGHQAVTPLIHHHLRWEAICAEELLRSSSLVVDRQHDPSSFQSIQIVCPFLHDFAALW